MSWQLWVLIATAATGVAVILLVKFRHAQEVFDRIVEPGPRPPADLYAVSSEQPPRPRRRNPQSARSPQPAHHQNRARGRRDLHATGSKRGHH